MLLSSEYNKLAWDIKRKYNIPLKWAMKSSYCLRELESSKPRNWLTKPCSPLARIWDPANVMKLVEVLRSQARIASNPNRRDKLTNAANEIYNKYRSLDGVGCEFISTILDGELVYWVTKHYVDSFIAKKNKAREVNGVALSLPDGKSFISYWFDFFGE